MRPQGSGWGRTWSCRDCSSRTAKRASRLSSWTCRRPPGARWCTRRVRRERCICAIRFWSTRRNGTRARGRGLWRSRRCIRLGRYGWRMGSRLWSWRFGGGLSGRHSRADIASAKTYADEIRRLQSSCVPQPVGRVGCGDPAIEGCYALMPSAEEALAEFASSMSSSSPTF